MKNLEELKMMREKVKKNLQLRSGKFRVKIVVGMGSCGIAAGAREVMSEFLDLIEKNKKTDSSYCCRLLWLLRPRTHDSCIH